MQNLLKHLLVTRFLWRAGIVAFIWIVLSALIFFQQHRVGSTLQEYQELKTQDLRVSKLSRAIALLKREAQEVTSYQEKLQSALLTFEEIFVEVPAVKQALKGKNLSVQLQVASQVQGGEGQLKNLRFFGSLEGGLNEFKRLVESLGTSRVLGHIEEIEMTGGEGIVAKTNTFRFAGNFFIK